MLLKRGVLLESQKEERKSSPFFAVGLDGPNSRIKRDATVLQLSLLPFAPLLEVCRLSKNPQLFLIVILAISTGMRQGEILNLTWADVDLEVGKAILHKTKNGERRVVPIVSVALELLRKHKQTQIVDTLFVFPNEQGTEPVKIRSAWERARKEAGVEDFRFHDLRHTFASYLAMNGASLPERMSQI